ncbi:MAG: HDOD domain-containing protein, partial [Pseudomonadota bacterium]
RQEMANANPNFNKLAAAVSSDVSLSGAVLQIINSPAFGARSKVTSINHACNMLGLVRVEKVVQAVALRGALSKGVSLDRFWDSANEIANLSRILAQKLSGIPADDAYTLGLFHDCGIPLLLQHFPDYKQTLIETNRTNVQPATLLEDERFGVNHTQVGHEVALQWFLPESIAEAILYHHQDLATQDEEDQQNDQVYSLIGILKMAEFISATLRKAWRNDDSHEWNVIGPRVLQVMGIDEDDFTEVCGEVMEDFRGS